MAPGNDFAKARSVPEEHAPYLRERIEQTEHHVQACHSRIDELAAQVSELRARFAPTPEPARPSRGSWWSILLPW